jgi:hypothetical protein
MASDQQCQDGQNGTRPHGERPPALPRAAQPQQRRDQQAISTLEHDGRSRSGDHIGSAPSLLGQLDQAKELGWTPAARHSPQVSQLVVPLACGVCAVSREHPEQYR